jgi:hypothetical protein
MMMTGQQFIDRRTGETFRFIGLASEPRDAVIGRPLVGSPLPLMAMLVPYDQVVPAALAPRFWQGALRDHRLR